MFEVRTGELVARLGGELLGDAQQVLRGIAPLDDAGADHISFIANPRYLAQLDESKAGCVVLRPEWREQAATRASAIVSPDPYLYFARLTQ
jgi:UDP-3-O-[3-hydroxymyristoyl] glucosamine N-acyltransferase